MAQLVRSRGWSVLLHRFLTPLLLQTNARLDAVGTPEFQTQFHRGTKHMVRRLLEEVYTMAQLPDPFQAHYDAFLVTLRTYAGEPEPSTPDNDTSPPVPSPPRRQGFPI